MIKVGDELPQGILRTKTATIHELKTDDMFSGKKVVVFSLPGAFTPTCSAKHLPGFKNLYQDIIDKGVDKIMCFAVNDPHVMKAWAEQNDVFGKIVGEPELGLIIPLKPLKWLPILKEFVSSLGSLITMPLDNGIPPKSIIFKSGEVP